MQRLSSEDIFLESVLENIPDMVFVKDATDLRFVRFNRVAEEILGYSRVELLGRSDYEFFPRAEADFFTRRDREVLAGKTVVEIPEEPIHTRARGVRILRTKKIPILGPDGRPLYLLGISEDITDRRRAELALAVERNRVEEWQRHLLGIVGHDLRNPLSAMMLWLQRLQRATGVTKQHADTVSRILSSAHRMNRLIHDLLDYKGSEGGGGIPIRPGPCDLDEVCREVLSELRAAHPGRELRYDSSGDGRGTWDSDRVAQALENLLVNALLYGQRDAPVRLHRWAVGDRVILEVANLGEPIPEALLPHIFEARFRVARSSHRRGGLGLGLFIVQGIVRGHGGRVSVRSSRSEGTVFTIRLPRHASRT